MRSFDHGASPNPAPDSGSFARGDRSNSVAAVGLFVIGAEQLMDKPYAKLTLRPTRKQREAADHTNRNIRESFR